MRYWLSFAPILSPVLNACGTPPPHHRPLEMAPQLLFLGHLGVVVNPEPDEMSHHTQTSATVGFPAPVEGNWRSCLVLIRVGLRERESYALEN